jgi:hypothetical protein
VLSVRRALVAAALAAASCGDLEADRICASPPCTVPGRPSPTCVKYLDCIQATSGSRASLDPTFGNNGTCWTAQHVADACTAACQSGLESFRASGASCNF